MEEEKNLGLVCDKCKGHSNRMVYRAHERLCPSCANDSRPRFAGMHEVRISEKKYGVRMTVAECERIKSTKRLADGSVWRPSRWRGEQ